MGFFRRVTRNWQLKTLAVALAVLLWVVVSADQVTTNWITVPLEVRVIDPAYEAEPDAVPAEVEVRVSGPGRDLLDLSFRKPPLVLVVNSVGNRIETRPLDPRMLQIPGQLPVQALEVRPNALQLVFTPVVTKRLPVRAQVRNQLTAGWMLVDTLRGEPAFIDVFGPLERVSPLEEVLTEPFEITQGDTLIDRRIAIDTVGLSGLRVSASTVRITGRVDRLARRHFSGVPVELPDGWMSVPERVEVTLTGPESRLRAMAATAVVVQPATPGSQLDAPSGGSLFSLRLAGLPAGTNATPAPAQVRIYPPGAVPDTLVAAPSAARPLAPPLPTEGPQ